MRKLWLPCVLWFLPLLGLGVGAAFSREVAPTSGVDASRILASSAYVASDAATPGIDCRLPAVPHANRSALAGVVQASGAAPRGDSGTGAEVAAMCGCTVRHAPTFHSNGGGSAIACCLGNGADCIG